jgi:hypothetical protein
MPYIYFYDIGANSGFNAARAVKRYLIKAKWGSPVTVASGI